MSTGAAIRYPPQALAARPTLRIRARHDGPGNCSGSGPAAGPGRPRSPTVSLDPGLVGLSRPISSNLGLSKALGTYKGWGEGSSGRGPTRHLKPPGPRGKFVPAAPRLRSGCGLRPPLRAPCGTTTSQSEQSPPPDQPAQTAPCASSGFLPLLPNSSGPGPRPTLYFQHRPIHPHVSHLHNHPPAVRSSTSAQLRRPGVRGHFLRSGGVSDPPSSAREAPPFTVSLPKGPESVRGEPVLSRSEGPARSPRRTESNHNPSPPDSLKQSPAGIQSLKLAPPALS